MKLGFVNFDVTNNFIFNFLLGRKPLPDGVAVVVERITALMIGFNLAHAEFLRLIPAEWSWTLGTLSDDRKLAAALSADRLNWLAQRFQVNRSWLEGTEERALPYTSGYKEVARFVDDLTTRGWVDEKLRMTILAAEYSSRSNEPLAQYVIVFSRPFVEWDSEPRTPVHYVVFENQMTWDHYPCRRDTKVLARWFSMAVNHLGTIPIVPVRHEVLQRIASGIELPGPYTPWAYGGYDRLEDRVLLPKESRRAIETDETESILDFARQELGDRLLPRPGSRLFELVGKSGAGPTPDADDILD